MHQSLALQCDILTSVSDVEKIADEWRALHSRVAHTFFGDYDEFIIWWRTLAQTMRVRPHIVVGRDASGKLKALLPLVLRKRGIMHFLEWAGDEVFDTKDALAENRYDAQTLWLFALSQEGYDVAKIRDMCGDGISAALLPSFMNFRKQHKNFYLPLDFDSGAEWFASNTRKLRSDIQRKKKKMEARGTVAFHFYNGDGEVVPSPVIDALFEQKQIWAAERHPGSVFLRSETRSFLHQFAEDAARKKILYLSWATCGNAIVACHMGFAHNQILHLYITAYDGDFGVYSPGNLMMVETIKHAIDERLRELNFMRGEEDYKQHFAGGYRELSDFACGKSLLGKMLLGLQREKN